MSDKRIHVEIGSSRAPSRRDWARMTLSREKARVFAGDTRFKDCWADLGEVFGVSAVDALCAVAVLIFKPDAVIGRRIPASLAFLEEHGFIPIVGETIRLHRRSAYAIWRYDWRTSPRDRIELSILMLSASETLILVLQDTKYDGTIPASIRLNQLKGAAEPEKRTKRHLRTVLAPPNWLCNFVHVCDEPADVVREVGILFDKRRRRSFFANLAQEVRAPAWIELKQRAEQLETRYPGHDLDFARSLARLKCSGLVSGADIEKIKSASKYETELRWDELRAMMDLSRPGANVWDFICVACEVVPFTDARAPMFSFPSEQRSRPRDRKSDRRALSCSPLNSAKGTSPSSSRP